MRLWIPALFAFLTPLLGACDQVNQRLGIEDLTKKEAKMDAEGKAVGSACRQSGRAIEDCYSLYHWLPKASVFAGWREMNDYMLANNLPVIEPKLPPAPPPEPPGKKPKKKVVVDSSNTLEKKPDADAKPESPEKQTAEAPKKH